MCKLLSHVQLFEISWTVAHQAPLSMEFSRQEWVATSFSTQGEFSPLQREHIHDWQERPWSLASGLCQCDVWKVWQLLLKVKILRSLLLFVRRYVTGDNQTYFGKNVKVPFPFSKTSSSCQEFLADRIQIRQNKECLAWLMEIMGLRARGGLEEWALLQGNT